MPKKTHSFTVFLLKSTFDPSNTLEDDHGLVHVKDATEVPDSDVLYIHDPIARPPWWKTFFGIQQSLNQSLKGAILFHKFDQRWLLFTFGNVRSKIKSESFEHDFGKMISLNLVDPDKLKSTDTLSPTVSQRQRTQMPLDSNLGLFGFDGRTTILRGITGKSLNEYSDIVRSVTGSDSVKVRTPYSISELDDFCDLLIELYESEKYKDKFPDIENIQPVRDPALIAKLDASLLAALHAKSSSVQLTYPDIVNYKDGVFVKFKGEGKSESFEDIMISNYYDYLESRKKSVSELEIEHLKKHKIGLVNENGWEDDQESVYKSIVWDLVDGTTTYHISGGLWFEVDNDYITSLETYIDQHIVPWTSIEYAHPKESDFNLALAKKLGAVCLDTKDISPPKQRQVEPCDVFCRASGNEFIHVKRSTLSAGLSHLFNQGSNSYELLVAEPESRKKFSELLKDHFEETEIETILEDIQSGKLKITFLVTTHKSVALGAKAFPLFSKISAFKILRGLDAFRIPATISLVPDKS